MCNATEKALSKFDNDVAEAIKYLLEIAEYFPTVDVVGNDIKIILSDTLASRRILTLKNVDVIPKDKAIKNTPDVYELSMKECFMLYYYNQLF